MSLVDRLGQPENGQKNNARYTIDRVKHFILVSY